MGENSPWMNMLAGRIISPHMVTCLQTIKWFQVEIKKILYILAFFTLILWCLLLLLFLKVSLCPSTNCLENNLVLGRRDLTFLYNWKGIQDCSNSMCWKISNIIFSSRNYWSQLGIKYSWKIHIYDEATSSCSRFSLKHLLLRASILFIS